MRCKSYIKNLFVFIPLFYSTQILMVEEFVKCVIAFISFSFIASTIYIVNDAADVESDRKHPTKKNRPLASGELSVKFGIGLAVVLFLTSIAIAVSLSINLLFVVLTYFIMNLLYSFKLKRIPIIDVFIIATGFVLRVLAGAVATDIKISSWMFIVVFTISLFLGFSKRYSETIMVEEGQTRKSLEKYGKEYLRSAVWMLMSITVIFYSLWCIDDSTVERIGTENFIFTIPIVLYAFFEYLHYIETGHDGDPVTMLYSNRKILCAIILYGILATFILFV